MKSSELNVLLESLPLGASYARHLSNKPIELNRYVSLALGENKRRLVRILATVVDAISNKLEVKAITTLDTALQAQINQWLQSIQWYLVQKDLYRYAVRDGRSYALVSYRNGAPYVDVLQVYDNDCGNGAYVWYDMNGNPSLAINTWYQGEDRYVDLFYPDRIEKYLLEDDKEEWVKRYDVLNEPWPIAYTDNNNLPLGIPLIEYSIGESDLADGAVQIQDDINKVIIDQLAIDRTMGYPLRYVKGNDPLAQRSGPGMPLLNQFGDPVRRSVELPPGSLYSLSPDSDLGQLDSATPNRTVFDMLLNLLTLVTKVPSHYFTGDWPSGLAIANSEIRLNGLVEDHQTMLTPAIVRTIQTMIRLSNTYAGTAYDPNTSIDATWYPPEITTQAVQIELDKALTVNVTTQVSMGVRSIESGVRMLNPDWTNAEVMAEVARIKTDKLVA